MNLATKRPLPDECVEAEAEEIIERLERRLDRYNELEQEQRALGGTAPTPQQLEDIEREKDRNLGAIQELGDQLKAKSGRKEGGEK